MKTWPVPWSLRRFCKAPTTAACLPDSDGCFADKKRKGKPGTARGTHHLLVSLQLRLARLSLLVPLLLAMACLTLTLTAVVLRHNDSHRDGPAQQQRHAPTVPQHRRAARHLNDSRAAHLQHESAALLPEGQHRLLLATHNRVAWWWPEDDGMLVLHEGQGVHYGMFPGEPQPGHPSTVWVVVRPHNWRPRSVKEHLLLLDAHTGAELRRVEIPARFSHDAIRMADKVYICSTGDGSLLELSYPSMALLRRLPLFSKHDHPNTLAAADDDGYHLWVLLHNLGESDLVKVYVGPDGPAREVSRVTGVGMKAHGLVAWGRELIMLDSDSGALVSLNPASGDEVDLYMVPEEGRFLKGLAVLDDVAYFGITNWAERSVRDSPANHGEVAAFDLNANALLWRRTVHTAGLLNIIGAPHLAPDSTYAATYSHGPARLAARPGGGPTTHGLLPSQAAAAGAQQQPAEPAAVLPDSQGLVQYVVDSLAAAGHPPVDIAPTGYWSSGWPRLSLEPKLTDWPEDAGLQLPLFHANISALRARVLALPPEAWTREYQAAHNAVLSGRTANMERFKPGVEGILLLFSDSDGALVYEFPAYRMLRAELEPLLLEVLGSQDVSGIVRLQLARMAPGTSDIKVHQDSGGYAINGHRIHVPLATHPLVLFEACPDGDGSAAAAAAAVTAPAAARPPQLAHHTQHASSQAAAALRVGDVGRRAHQATPQLPQALHHQDGTAVPHSPEGGPESGLGDAQQRQRRRRLLLRSAPSGEERQPPGTFAEGLWRAPGQEGQGLQEAGPPHMPRPLELPPWEAVAHYYAGEDAPEHAQEHASWQPHAEAAHGTLPQRQAHQRRHAPQHAPQSLSSQPPVGQWQQPAPAVQHHHQQHHQQQHQQHRHAIQHRARPCVRLPAPEGLVFELNNRVPHKVANPAASATARVHLVIDVFEQPRVRTPLPPGAACEYGAAPEAAARALQRMAALPQAEFDLAAVAAEVRALVASPGITCVAPDGARILPRGAEGGLRPADEEVVQQVLARLQQQRAAAMMGQRQQPVTAR